MFGGCMTRVHSIATIEKAVRDYYPQRGREQKSGEDQIFFKTQECTKINGKKLKALRTNRGDAWKRL